MWRAATGCSSSDVGTRPDRRLPMRAKLFLGCVVLSLAAAIAYCQAPGEPAGKDPTYPKKGNKGGGKGNKGGGPGMRPTLAHPQWEYTVRNMDDIMDRGK